MLEPAARATDPIPNDGYFDFQPADDKGFCRCTFLAFNTVVTMSACGIAEDGARKAFERARDECRRYERLLSRTLPHSDVARINDMAGSAVEIAADTYRVCECARHYCAESDGLFDITMGAVTRLWNFHEGVVPNERDLEASLAHVDWRALTVWRSVHENAQEHSHFARLDAPARAIDLGGIAKGYITDQLANLFSKLGIPTFMINLGGNLLVHGRKPDGKRWMVGIRDPHDSSQILGAVEVESASVVTSGIYERSFEKDGVRYHHILDPKTGYPAHTDVASATVIAEKSIDAEGYSTTLLMLGREAGTRFAAAHQSIAHAIFVDDQNQIIAVK